MDFPLFWFLSDSYTHISPTKEYKCELNLMIGGPQTFRLHIRSKYEPFLSFTYLALNPLLPPGSGKEPIVRGRQFRLGPPIERGGISKSGGGVFYGRRFLSLYFRPSVAMRAKDNGGSFRRLFAPFRRFSPPPSLLVYQSACSVRARSIANEVC